MSRTAVTNVLAPFKKYRVHSSHPYDTSILLTNHEHIYYRFGGDEGCARKRDLVGVFKQEQSVVSIHEPISQSWRPALALAYEGNNNHFMEELEVLCEEIMESSNLPNHRGTLVFAIDSSGIREVHFIFPASLQQDGSPSADAICEICRPLVPSTFRMLPARERVTYHRSWTLIATVDDDIVMCNDDTVNPERVLTFPTVNIAHQVQTEVNLGDLLKNNACPRTDTRTANLRSLLGCPSPGNFHIAEEQVSDLLRAICVTYQNNPNALPPLVQCFSDVSPFAIDIDLKLCGGENITPHDFIQVTRHHADQPLSHAIQAVMAEAFPEVPAGDRIMLVLHSCGRKGDGFKVSYHLHWPRIYLERAVQKQLAERIAASLTSTYSRDGVFHGESWAAASGRPGIIDGSIYRASMGLRMVLVDKREWQLCDQCKALPSAQQKAKAKFRCNNGCKIVPHGRPLMPLLLVDAEGVEMTPVRDLELDWVLQATSIWMPSCTPTPYNGAIPESHSGSVQVEGAPGRRPSPSRSTNESINIPIDSPKGQAIAEMLRNWLVSTGASLHSISERKGRKFPIYTVGLRNTPRECPASGDQHSENAPNYIVVRLEGNYIAACVKCLKQGCGGKNKRISLCTPSQYIALLFGIQPANCTPARNRRSAMSERTTRDLETIDQGQLEERLCAHDERFAVVLDGKECMVYDRRCASPIPGIPFVHTVIRPGAFKSLTKEMVKVQWGDKVEVVDIAAEWYETRQGKRCYDTYALMPPPRVCPDNILNTYEGPSLNSNALTTMEGLDEEARDGKWQAIRNFIESHTCNGDPELIDYVWNWMARMMQQPAHLARTAIVLHGEQGTGKTLTAEILTCLWGIHSKKVTTKKQALGQFTAGLHRNTIAVFLDEFQCKDDEMIAHLKQLVTESTLRVEEKHVAAREICNILKVVVCCDGDFALKLGKHARRFVVIRPSNRHRNQSKFFASVWKCKEDPVARVCMWDWLMRRDISAFDPSAIPRSVCKYIFINKKSGMNLFERWLYHVLGEGTLYESRAQCLSRTYPLQTLEYDITQFGKRQHIPRPDMSVREWLQSTFSVDIHTENGVVVSFPPLDELRHEFAQLFDTPVEDVWPNLPSPMDTD